jgi:hypothetical protein
VARRRPGLVQVSFDNGQTREIDFTAFAQPGTLYEPLADPAFAGKCRIVDGGDALRWPNGLDWSAGAVYKESRPVKAAEASRR